MKSSCNERGLLKLTVSASFTADCHWITEAKPVTCATQWLAALKWTRTTSVSVRPWAGLLGFLASQRLHHTDCLDVKDMRTSSVLHSEAALPDRLPQGQEPEDFWFWAPKSKRIASSCKASSWPCLCSTITIIKNNIFQQNMLITTNCCFMKEKDVITTFPTSSSCHWCSAHSCVLLENLGAHLRIFYAMITRKPQRFFPQWILGDSVFLRTQRVVGRYWRITGACVTSLLQSIKSSKSQAR